jgi:hypothetical protein
MDGKAGSSGIGKSGDCLHGDEVKGISRKDSMDCERHRLGRSPAWGSAFVLRRDIL